MPRLPRAMLFSSKVEIYRFCTDGKLVIEYKGSSGAITRWQRVRSIGSKLEIEIRCCDGEFLQVVIW